VILEEIVAHKLQELSERKQAMPLPELKALGAGRPAILELDRALRARGVSLIAEVKRASPSRGVLCRDFDPMRLARTYWQSGAAAISVLTDACFFQGELDHLVRIKRALGPTIPVLRKDFVLDPYQVYETWAHGSDALLLIVAILADEQLSELLTLTRDLGMTALVEVHDEGELRRALRFHPRVVGINSRNLRDFTVDLATVGRLAPLLPSDVVTVAESGVHTADDVRYAGDLGADAVLVGEALVTAPDTAEKVRELVTGGSL
jgi:indole-3-glycerol phosphate synthase